MRHTFWLVIGLIITVYLQLWLPLITPYMIPSLVLGYLYATKQHFKFKTSLLLSLLAGLALDAYSGVLVGARVLFLMLFILFTYWRFNNGKKAALDLIEVIYLFITAISYKLWLLGLSLITVSEPNITMRFWLLLFVDAILTVVFALLVRRSLQFRQSHV